VDVGIGIGTVHKGRQKVCMGVEKTNEEKRLCRMGVGEDRTSPYKCCNTSIVNSPIGKYVLLNYYLGTIFMTVKEISFFFSTLIGWGGQNFKTK
jgi:hypothetical protein